MLKGSTAVSTRKSLLFSFLDRYASLVVEVASSMLLARLLTPSDIGVFSVTMALLALGTTVRDMGAGQYVAQERQLTPDRIRAVWAVQLGVGLLLSVVVFAASIPVASFYNEPRMRSIMVVIAVNYAINPFGSITYALLMRDMRYDSVAIIRFSAALVGSVVSVVLAWNGNGPMSLAWGSLSATAAGALASICLRPRSAPWLPGIAGIPRVLSFGTKMTATTIIGTLARCGPEFFLGKVQGFVGAGLYSRANGLAGMFNKLVMDGVYPVALSLFAKEARAGVDVRDSFRMSVCYVTALAWPFAVVICFLAHPLVRALYGDQWDQAVDIARLLSVAVAFAVPAGLCHGVLVATGAVSKILKVSILSGISTLCLAGVGACYGLTQIGVAMVVSSLITSFLWLTTVKSVIQFDWHSLLRASLSNVWLCAAAAIAPAAVCLAWGAEPADPIPSLVVGATGSFVAFLAALKLTRHPFSAEVDTLLSTIKQTLFRRRASKGA